MFVSRRHFFLGSLALPLLAAKKAAPPPPNIVLVIADQLPCWMLGAYGNKEVRTPAIDLLARSGTRFLDNFACAPSPELGRATLLTGRTPMQLGESGISAADVPLEKVLAGAGYRCRTTGDMADAGKFLDSQSGAAPFFLNVNDTSLRAPYDGIPQKFLDMYAARNFPDYSVEPAAPEARQGKEMLAGRVAAWRKVAAGVSALDDGVGSLVSKIHGKQLVDRTLIVVTATCGALLGRRGLWGDGDASDPVNMFDEVVKTPLIWNWPGQVPTQATPVELVSAYDLLPTLCAAAGIAAPSRNLCGRSYLSLATGKPLPKKQRWRTTVLGRYKNTDMAREERYKLVLRNEGKGPNELYDLPADPGERTNQAANDQYITVKNSLGAELANWKRQYST